MAGNQNTAYTEKGLRALLTQFKEKPDTDSQSDLAGMKYANAGSTLQTSAAADRAAVKAPDLNEMYQQTVKTLTMTPDVKNYSGLNPIEDAQRLMENYQDTLYRSTILNKDSAKGKNPFAIAQKEYENALSTTMARYQTNGLDAQGMQDWLSRSGFQSQGDVDRLNEQNMITTARKMQNQAARDKYLNGPEGAAGLSNWAQEVSFLEKTAPGILDAIANGNLDDQEGIERISQLTGITPVELPARAGEAQSIIQRRLDQLLGAPGSGTAQGARDYLAKNGYNLGFLEAHPKDAQEYLDFYRDIPRIAQMVQEGREDELTDRELELWEADSALGNNLKRWDVPDPMAVVTKYAADTASGIQNALGLNNAAWQPTDAQRYVYSQYLDTLEGAQAYAEESRGTAREKQAQDNLWFVKNRENYKALPGEISEYEKKSAYDENLSFGNEDLLLWYQAINGHNEGLMARLTNPLYAGASDMIRAQADDYRKFAENLQPEEKALFNALMAEGRTDEAQEYLRYMEYEVDARANIRFSEFADQLAGNGTWGQIGASALSVPLSLLRGAGYMDVLAQQARNGLGTEAEYRPVNYENAFAAGRSADALRDAVMQNVNWGAQILGQDVDLFDFLYGTTMSGADSLAAGLAGPVAGAMILGAGAAQSTMDDLYKNGATDQQILIGGTAAGIFETLFEKMSLGAFYDEANALTKPTFKAHLKNIGAQMGINFSEEFNTELADILFDKGFMGKDSKSSRQIQEYLRLGMTEEEAKQKVAEELTWQCLEAGLGGALMGAGFGALSNISSSANYRGHTQELGARFSAETKGSLWDIAKTLGVERAAKTSAETASNKQVGQVYRDVVKRLPENLRAPLQESVKRDTLNEMKRMGGTADGEGAGSAVIALLEGKELTDAQTDALAGDELTLKVIQDLLGANETAAAAETEAQERPEEKQEAQEEEPWEAPPEGAEFAGNEETDTGTGLRYDTPAGADLGMDAQRRAGEKARREQNPAILEGKLKTGETAAIQRVEMNEDTLRPQAVLEDGQTISLDDMDLTQEEQILLNAAADMNEEAGRDLMRLSPDGGSVTDYARGYKQVYSSAAEGRGLNDLQTAQTAALTDEQRRAAWEAGRREWERKNGGAGTSVQQLPEEKPFTFAQRGGDSLNVKSAAESAEGTVEITTEDGNTLALDEADLADDDKTILREAAQMEDQEAAAAMIRVWQDEQKARTRAAAGNRIQNRLAAEDAAKRSAQQIDQEARRAEEQRKAKEAIDQAYEAAIRERERLAAEAEEKARAAQERQRQADEAERQAKAAADAAQEAREAEENARQAAQAEREAEEARERQEQADEADRQEKAAIDQAYEAALQEQARLEAEAEEKARAAQERQQQADEAERQAKAAADAAQEAREAEENARRAEEEAKRAKEAADKEAALQEAQQAAKDEIDRAYEAAIREQERLAAEAEQKTRDAQAQQQKAEEAEKAAKAAADAAREAREAEEKAGREAKEQQSDIEKADQDEAKQEALRAAKEEIDRAYDAAMRERERLAAEAEQKAKAAQEEQQKAEEAEKAAKAAADAARQAKEEAEKKAAARKESKLADMDAEEKKARQREELLAEQAKAQQEADILAQEAMAATEKAEKAKAEAERKARKLADADAGKMEKAAYAVLLEEQAKAQREADALAQEALEATRKAEKAKADAERKAQKILDLQAAENDAQTFARGFRRVYEAAASGRKLESIYGELLTDSQRQAAQAAGEAARERRENKIAALNEQAAKESGFRALRKETGNDAGLYFARVTARTRGPETDVQLRLIDLFARETGMQVRVYDTLGDANASYTQGTNIVNLGLDAEDGALTRAVSHEGYHFINQWSPGQGLKIKNFVLDALATRPEYDLEGRIREIQERYSRGGQELSRAKAEEEIVGNSLLDVIGTEENLKSLFKKDQTLAEKIGEWAKKTAGLLKGLVQRYAKHNRVTADALRVSEQMQGIADMYLQAAKNAGQNFLRAGLGMNETARSDADIREYEQDMKKATDNDDARANLEALLSKLYLRAEQGWIGSNTEQYENGFERFKGALRAYMAKENPVALSVALEQAGLDAQPAEMNPQLTYAARQLADADERQITRLPEEAFNLKDDDAKAIQDKYPSSAVKVGTYQTAKQLATVESYLGAVDSRVLEAAKVYKQNRNATFLRISLSEVTEKQAADINRITGFNVIGYKHDVDRNFFIHVEERHGEEHGHNHDHTMQDLNDVARVGWVIENYDHVEPLIDEETQKMDESYGYLDKNKEPMPMIRYTKQIDGTLYVVEAVGENKWKKLHVVSAYMQKNNPAKENSQGGTVPRMPHAVNGLGHNVQNAYTSTDDPSISQLSEPVNRDLNLKDDEYMEAVESGDTETAQQLADEAAEQAMKNSKIRDEDGNLLPVYHGTSEEFNSFDMSKGRANMDIQGAFFSPWEIDAGGYGENVRRFYLDIQNPATEAQAYKALNMFKGQNNAGIKAKKYLISRGYDGVNGEGMEYIAFYPEQIKSADAITYDDAGNVIPLSQRFSTQSNDIRYNLKDDGGDIVGDVRDDADLYAQAMSDQEIRDSLESAGRLLAFIQQNSLRQKDTESWKKWTREYAKKVLTETGSKYSAQKLQKELNQVYEAIDKGGYNAGELMIRLRELGRRVLEAAPGVVVEMDETTKAARDALKTGAFYLTEDQKEAIQLRYGSMGAYMRKNFGKLAIRKRAQGAQKGARSSLADVWNESLAPLLPSVFAQDTIEADMPEIIDAFLETSGEKKYAGEFGRNIGQYATSLGLEMLRDYLNAPFIQDSIGKLREGMEARVGDAYQREQEARARAAALQESFRSKTEGIREHYQEKYEQRIQRDKERRENTEERQKAIKDIQSKVRRINTMTVNPTNQRHVPEELRGAAISAIRPFLSNTSVFSRADLDRLSSEYAALMERKGEMTGLDADILDDIRGMAETMDGKRLSQLTNAELSSVQDVIGNLYKVITEQNEAKVNGMETTIDLLSGQMKEDMRKMGDAKTGPIRDKIRWLMLREMTPIYFADNAGPTLKAMIKDFYGGMETWMNIAEKAKEAETELIRKYRVNDWINDKNTLRFISQRGERLELNRREALSLYALWKRETTNKIQNAKHLQIGGFTYEKGARYQGVDTLRPHIIAQSDMDQVRSFLGKNQMEFADEMVKYLTETLGEEGNKVSMELYGFKKFKEGYYFPYETDRHYLVGELTQTGERTRQPKDQGMSKATLKNAATPIMLHDFFQVWGNHVNNMGLYAGFAQSVDLMNRVLNDRISAEVTMDPATNLLKVLPAESNWAAMARAMGDEGVQYLKTLVKDVAGGVRADERGFAAKGLTMMKKASVAANLSVALQQPTAYARAMLMVNPRYMLVTPADLAKLPQRIRTMYEYSGVAKVKRMGKFDTGTGKGAVAWITEPVNDPSKMKRALEKIDDVTGIGAEKADEWTWGILWGAIEKETQNTRAELKPGTKEFYQAVKERFEDVVNHTQVYDSVLSRSEWMRSNTTMDKMLTSFMAEPTLSLNMLMDSFRKLKSPGGKKIAARAAGVFLVNALLTAMAKGIMTATRKKDEEGKTWTEKYLAAAAGEFMEDISPFGLAGMIPWARDVVSLLEGYDVERSDMDAVEMLVNAYKTLTNENKSAEDKIQAISGAVGNVFGIPAKNIWRDGEAILRTMFGGASAAEPTSPGALKYSILDEMRMGPISLWDSSRNAYYTRMADALARGDMDNYNELYQYVNSTEGVKEKTVITGIKAALQNQVEAGRMATETAAQLLEERLGVKAGEGYFTVKKWMDGENKYDDFIDAVKTGTDLKATIKAYTDNGVETGTLKTELGKAVKSGEVTEKQAMEALTRNLGFPENDSYWAVKEWLGGDDYKKYSDFWKAVETGQNLRSVIKVYTDHGVETGTLAGQITSYFKPLYIEAAKRSKVEAANLKARILTAYEALGYDRNKKSKDIDAWLKQ